MDTSLVKTKTPEQQELEKKFLELAEIESKLAQRELDLATFHVELQTFEREYQKNIGIRYAELDRIEAQIEEYTAYLESSKNFKPSPSLKKLYREVAKLIHPDLATEEADKKRRQELMADVNEAYENGDEDRLREILTNWQNSPESVEGEGIAAQLIKVIRQISQSMARLKAIETEIKALEATELYQLKQQVLKASQEGRDLFAEMILHLDEQITNAQEKLDELKDKLEL